MIETMKRHYIALIHVEPGSCYGVSFPDLPGVISAGDTLDEAVAEAQDALALAAEGADGRLPPPRSLDALHADPSLADDLAGAVLVAVPVPFAPAAAAE